MPFFLLLAKYIWVTVLALLALEIFKYRISLRCWNQWVLLITVLYKVFRRLDINLRKNGTSSLAFSYNKKDVIDLLG